MKLMAVTPLSILSHPKSFFFRNFFFFIFSFMFIRTDTVLFGAMVVLKGKSKVTGYFLFDHAD